MKIEHNRFVLYFETDEESGSKDLIYYLKKNLEKVGEPELIVCTDSGVIDYKHFCITTSLRGLMNFNLKFTMSY